MAAKLEDRVLDNGLSCLDTEPDKICICGTSQPTTFTAANSTNLLGAKTLAAGGVFGSPAAATPNGRKVSSVAVTDGAITVSGTAAFWAIVDTVNSRLLAAGPLASNVVVTNGDTFTLASFDIAIPNQ